MAWRYQQRAATSPYVRRDIASPDGELAATAVIRAAALGALRFVFLLEWHWRADGQSAAQQLIRDVIALARAAGAHGVAGLAMPGTVQRGLLQRAGFVPIPRSLLPRTSVVSVRVDREGQDLASWTERARWYLTCGDGLIL